MYHKLITCSSSLALYLLLLTILGDHLANGNGIVMEHAEGILDHTQSHSPTHHMDQSTLVFFTLDDLKLGSVLPIYFRGTNPSSSSPQFLPREEANSIPFSLSKLPFLVQYFGFSRGSSQAKAMENTLRECVVKPIKGETKLCATSLESMLDFVHEMLGVTVQVRVLSTQKLKTSATNVLRNYTIVDHQPREVEASKMVACHTMPYPYVIYYCHHHNSESKVFQVSLKSDNNNDDDDNDDDNVFEAVAVCHMDTSQWSQNHASFKVLGMKPGTSPVCHFFPEDNLVWVPSSNKDDMSLRNHVSPI